ncbi:AfsA-related hotdog domain-containing protein [Streptomyces sp. T-3]|nr:AfsA-related hotdog domain-containing protein [Streptomyces sp. T-3]
MSQHTALEGLDVRTSAGLMERRLRPRDAPDGEERFVLHGRMPQDPLFADAPHHRDARVFVELIRQAGLQIGHQHFGVPAEHQCLFYKFTLRPDGLGATRPARPDARMALDLRATPTKTVAGVPRGLKLGGTMRAEGSWGCTGSAELVFLTPTVIRNHRSASRQAALAARPLPAVVAEPADPGEVGRLEPDHVVVSAPVGEGSLLTMAVLVDPANRAFFTDSADSVPGLLLVEALAQGTLLTVGRVHGFATRHTVLTHMSVQVRGYAEPDLPLSCTARSEPGGIDSEGRRLAHVRLSLEQADRVTAQAEVVATETG